MGRSKVTPEMHEEVLLRDRMCIGYRIDNGHACRDVWGIPHSPYLIEKLTVDHVKQYLMLGRRAPSDVAHLVAACWELNVGVPSKAIRAAERAYLADLYPDVWGREAA